MPAFRAPDPDSIIATHPTGAVLAVGPLAVNPKHWPFRKLRVVLPAGQGQRSYWCSWIIPEARMARGGHGWRLQREHPDIYAWACAECARELTAEDAQEAHGITAEEWADIVAAREQAKNTA